MDNEKEHPPLTETQKLLFLAESAGLKETEEMRRIRESLRADEDIEVTRTKASNYWELGQQAVEQTGPDTRRAQIGLLISVAAMFKQLGMEENYLENLNDALLCSTQQNLPDLADPLKLIVLLETHKSKTNPSDPRRR